MPSVIPGQSFQVAGGLILDEKTRFNHDTNAPKPVVDSSKVLSTDPNQFDDGDYRKLARSFSNLQADVQSAKSKKVKEETDSVTEDLVLTTRIKIETKLPPKRSDSNWALDEEFPDQITTFELITPVSDVECRYALNELMAMIEDDQCERFYILDEVGLTAAVVCGARTAFWSGTTTALRSDLTKRGIAFTIPGTAVSVNGVDRLRELQGDVNLSIPTVSHLEEKTLTLYFDTTFTVRGMIEAFVNVTRKDAKLRIIASQPFPGCTIKVSRAKIAQKLSKSTDNAQWSLSCDGYFTVLDIDKMVRAFTRTNGERDVRVYLEKLSLTKDFDRVAQIVFKNDDAEEEFI